MDSGEGVHELPLIEALVTQGRRFLKPLRYDASDAEAFPNALLLDAGSIARPLHLLSPFMSERARAAKLRLIREASPEPWVWGTDRPMPPLPATGTAMG